MPIQVAISALLLPTILTLLVALIVWQTLQGTAQHIVDKLSKGCGEFEEDRRD